MLGSTVDVVVVGERPDADEDRGLGFGVDWGHGRHARRQLPRLAELLVQLLEGGVDSEAEEVRGPGVALRQAAAELDGEEGASVCALRR